MAEDGKLVGAIVSAILCVKKPLRSFAAARTLGVKRFVMLTGDSENVAANVAQQLGIDEYVSRVLRRTSALTSRSTVQKDIPLPW